MSNAVTVQVPDLLARQQEAEQAFLAKFYGGQYTFDSPLIQYNPYLINPCAALILFRTEEEIAVTVTVRGKEPAGDISHTYPPAQIHILPILGLYDNAENQVDVTLYQGPTRTFTIQTTGHPMATKVLSMQADPLWFHEELVILTPALAGFPTGVDYRGDIRWYLTENMVFAGKRLANGHFMIGTHRKLMAPYNTSGLYEMDMVGKIYREYRIPGLYHHDQVELENGDLLVLTQDVPGTTVEDVCVLIDRENGQVKRTIRFSDFLPIGAAPSGSWSEHDWFHNNALAYDRNNHSLTLSGRHMDALVNIDLNTLAINWIIGDPEGWPQEMHRYFFTPVQGESFSWQYEQHAVLLSDNGDIMCFDNGHWRSKNPESYVSNENNYSRGVRYRIDRSSRTIRQVWSYGKERGPEFFSQYICNVEHYGNHRYLVHSGGIQRKDGKNVEGFIPPDEMATSDVLSRTVEVYDNKVLWELCVKGNYYRATKLPLYRQGSNLILGPGAHLGTLFRSSMQTAETFQEPDANHLLPEEHCLHLVEEFDCFSLKGRFPDHSVVVPYLKQGAQVLALPFSTAPNKFAPVSCLPYLPVHPDNKNASYSKVGLSGSYELYVSVDGVCYSTSQTLTCTD